MSKKIYTTLIVLFCTFTSVLAQDITFQELTPENGLSQVSVNDLYQDENNFIWIATRDGLNSYNGTKVRVFKSELEHSSSFTSNNILKLTGDKKGHLFILTKEGLAQFNIETETFSTLSSGSDITAIHFNDRLYYARGKSIYTINSDTNESELFYELKQITGYITSLFYDNDGILYIGTSSDGAFAIKPGNFEIEQVFGTANVVSFYEDSLGTIWVGTWEHGLYTISGDQVENYMHNASDKNSLPSNFIRSICEDNNGNIWIGSLLGLSRIDKQTKNLKNYLVSHGDGYTNSSIWSIIKDHQGTIWMGTYFGGVKYFNPEYEIYTYYPVSDGTDPGLSSSVVGKIQEDKYGRVWICTEGGGITVYDPSKNSYTWYKYSENNPNSLSHNNIKSIYYDELGDIMWIGAHLGGLTKLDLKTNKFTRYKLLDGDITANTVRDIVPHENKLLLATHKGVIAFDPVTGKNYPLLSGNKKSFLFERVVDLLIDSEELLWISVEGEGVFTYDFENQELVGFENNLFMSNKKNIYNIIEDTNKDLWFSSNDSGLIQYKREKGQFLGYNSHNSELLSDCLYQVSLGGGDNLLTISSQGFSIFDKKTKTFKNYNRYNGFPITSINEYGLYYSPEGVVYLGSVNGMISFKEKSIEVPVKPYNILFTRLVLDNQFDDFPKQNLLIGKDEIELHEGISVFSVEYAVANFIAANKDKLYYRLEGFSEEWTNLSDQPVINYTNITPGNYTLVLSNRDSSDLHEARLSIHVIPHWYKSNLAYFIYTLISLLILFLVVREYDSRIQLKAQLKYKQKHLHDIELLNQKKLQFFTNISHEIRTPLTLIIGQIEILLHSTDLSTAMHNKIHNVYNNSVQLKELISELLDFRKHEEGCLEIKVNQNDLVQFAYQIYTTFQANQNNDKVKFVFDCTIEELDVWFDRQHLRKAINNLLSNAFKFTTEGEVTLSIEADSEFAKILVKDTGVGIDAQKISHIFEYFYQVEDNVILNSGTGIGLALSKGIVDLHHGRLEVSSVKEEGTEFCIYLPLGREHFRADQFKVSDPKQTKSLQADKLGGPDVLGPMTVKSKDVDKLTKSAKILIVEDDASLRDMLVSLFGPLYTVIVAKDGVEAYDLVLSESPDIVLSDVIMPKMTGTELCKKIKDNVDTSHIPVVLITAKSALEHNLEGLKLGADDYITKPFNTTVLVSRCNNLVNSRNLLKEKFAQQLSLNSDIVATNPLDKKLIDDVQAIVEDNLDNAGFTIDQLAQDMGMARTALYKRFKEITGNTPNEFITEVRLKKAAYLLRNHPEYDISQISYMVGFSTPRYFSTCFKNHYNVKPSDYRNVPVSEN